MLLQLCKLKASKWQWNKISNIQDYLSLLIMKSKHVSHAQHFPSLSITALFIILQHSTLCHSPLLSSTALSVILHHSPAQHSPSLSSTALHHSPAQHSPSLSSTALSITLQHSTLHHSPAQHSLSLSTADRWWRSVRVHSEHNYELLYGK